MAFRSYISQFQTLNDNFTTVLNLLIQKNVEHVFSNNIDNDDFLSNHFIVLKIYFLKYFKIFNYK